MDIGLAAEQERLIKMEMERQQSELKVSFYVNGPKYRTFLSGTLPWTDSVIGKFSQN